MPLVSAPCSDLVAALEEIRNYTTANPALRACHHFSFDFRLGAFDRATFIIMGLNPGETPDDYGVAPGPAEESSLVDYRQGVDSPSRRRWFRTCREIVGGDSVTLSELFFWSSPDLRILQARLGPLARSPHAAFCRDLNQRLIAAHQPAAVVLPGLSLIPLAAALYGLTLVTTLHDAKGRLIVHCEQNGLPWIFTRHWSGARGFTRESRETISAYLRALPMRRAREAVG